MIHFENITEENLKSVFDLKVAEHQSKFVAPNSWSLCQAYVYKDEGDDFPFAIYNDDTVVGFVMFEHDADDIKGQGLIWRIMIDQKFQGKGYGTEAIKLAIDYFKKQNYHTILIDYVIGNNAAAHIYKKLGFKDTGKIEDGEVILKMEL